MRAMMMSAGAFPAAHTCLHRETHLLCPCHFNHLMLPTRENKINGLLISRNDSSSTCFGLYFIIGVHQGNSKMMVLISPPPQKKKLPGSGIKGSSEPLRGFLLFAQV